MAVEVGAAEMIRGFPSGAGLEKCHRGNRWTSPGSRSAMENAPGVEPIRKTSAERLAANMTGDPTASGLGWETYRQWIDGLPGGRLNIAYEAIDRHIAHGRGERDRRGVRTGRSARIRGFISMKPSALGGRPHPVRRAGQTVPRRRA